METPYPSAEFWRGLEEFFFGREGECVEQLLKGCRLNWMNRFLTRGKEQGIPDTESSLNTETGEMCDLWKENKVVCLQVK